LVAPTFLDTPVSGGGFMFLRFGWIHQLQLTSVEVSWKFDLSARPRTCKYPSFMLSTGPYSSLSCAPQSSDVFLVAIRCMVHVSILPDGFSFKLLTWHLQSVAEISDDFWRTIKCQEGLGNRSWESMSWGQLRVEDALKISTRFLQKTKDCEVPFSPATCIQCRMPRPAPARDWIIGFGGSLACGCRKHGVSPGRGKPWRWHFLKKLLNQPFTKVAGGSGVCNHAALVKEFLCFFTHITDYVGFNFFWGFSNDLLNLDEIQWCWGRLHITFCPSSSSTYQTHHHLDVTWWYR
jgi:hypothetical protein